MSAAPNDPPPALLHGGSPAPRAWLAAIHGGLWVCWDDRSRHGAPDPDCWQRVDMPPGAPDPRELRAVFLDAGTVVVRGAEGEVLQLVRGDPALQVVDAGFIAVEPRQRLAPVPCGPNGHVPTYSRGRWAWSAAPCSAAAGQCVAPPALPGLRRPAGLDLFFTIEVRASERREVAAATEAITGSSVLASLGWAFDPARSLGRRIAWHELQSARRPRLRDLPPLRGTGPVAAREREALAAVLCGGQVR